MRVVSKLLHSQLIEKYLIYRVIVASTGMCS